MAASYIPAGYHTVTAYLYIRGAAAAIDFYKAAFGATEILRMPGPDGRLGHAEIKIGDTPLMMADESEPMHALGPQSRGGPTASFMIYVPDVDAAFAKAVAAGAIVQRPLADQFYGDRNGIVVDPFGHVWTLATHLEDVSPEEMDERMKKMTGAA